MGIYNRASIGKLASALVVIGNYEIYSVFLGILYLCSRGYSRVYGNYELYFVVRENIYRRARNSVALSLSLWDLYANISAKLTKIQIEHADRSNSVNVIISVYAYFFVFFNCRKNSIHCLVHIGKQIWVVKIGFLKAQKQLRFLGISVASVVEQHGKKLTFAECLRHIANYRVAFAVAKDIALVPHPLSLIIFHWVPLYKHKL